MATVQTQNLEPVPSQTPMLESDQKLITPTWMRWFTNMRAKINVINASIVAIAGNSGAGFLSSNGTGTVTSRTLTAGTGVTITNPDGVGGNPVISATGASPLTTKGDLYTFGTANARLPVGTDGQTVIADSTQTLGIKWGAGTGGGVTQSGSVVVTPTASAQVTTNITLSPTLTSLTNTLVSINYSSNTAAYSSSPTSATLTSTSNLQLITDALIGATGHTQTINWWVSGVFGIAGVTWNPADKSSNITLSGGNLIATQGSTGWDSVRGTLGRSSGKYYFEAILGTSPTYTIIGVTNNAASLSNYAGADNNGWSYYGVNGTTIHNAAQNAYGSTYTMSDVIGIAIDLTAGKIWFSKNGTWQNSGDPVAGTGQAWSGLSGTLYPTVSPYDSGTVWTGRFDLAQFTYALPTGYTSWSGV